jgi:acetate kinase
VRRYGFHGLSHAYASQRALELIGRPIAGSRVVTCHLGGGASVCAVRDGRSVDTTMGFTPLEGLVMATRSGSVDPGLLLWLLEHEGLAPHEVAEALERRSGLAALAGTGDMREITALVEDGDEAAVLALDVYVHHLAAAVAAMATSAGGLDVLVFTGGVGEHTPLVREMCADRLRWLGVVLDGAENEAADGDHEITGPAGTVRTMVVTAREDRQIAGEARVVLDRGRVSGCG